jgi:hypothetical protein
MNGTKKKTLEEKRKIFIVFRVVVVVTALFYMYAVKIAKHMLLCQYTVKLV